MKTYILMLIISGWADDQRTSITQEFNSLTQCEYVYKTLTEQMRKANTELRAGGCFAK